MTPRSSGLPGADPDPGAPSCTRAPGGAVRGPAVSRLGRLWPWLLVCIYMASIFHLSSQPNPLPELTARFWDKGLHFVEYGTLGALLLFAIRRSGAGPRAAFLLAVAGASLYGASDEFHQSFVSGRSCEVLDWVADTLGGAMGAALLALALRLVRAPASIRRGSGRG